MKEEQALSQCYALRYQASKTVVFMSRSQCVSPSLTLWMEDLCRLHCMTQGPWQFDCANLVCIHTKTSWRTKTFIFWKQKKIISIRAWSHRCSYLRHQMVLVTSGWLQILKCCVQISNERNYCIISFIRTLDTSQHSVIRETAGEICVLI